MNLSNDIISQFAKMTTSDKQNTKETTVYGTIVKLDNTTYVRLDGSELLTPLKTTVDVIAGERVTVMIKDHVAIVTGNMSSPSARTDDVLDIKNTVDKLDVKYASIEKLDVTNAKIINLESDKLSVEDAVIKYASIEKLDVTNADIKKLQADKANITDLDVINADIKKLQVDKANITDLDVINADIEKLQVDIANVTDLEVINADIKKLQVDKANITDLDVTNADIEELQVDKANITDLQVTNAEVNSLKVNKASINDLQATNAEINNLKVDKADINLANIDDASIKNAMIGDAQINTAKIEDSSITTAKIKDAAITETTIHEGAITTAKIADASITNAKIDSLDAEKIKTGTLETERLILVDNETGKRSVITALNEDAKNQLDGVVIQEKTIDAAKIRVEDLDAFEATIGSFDIDSSSIHSKKKAINDPTAGVFVGTTGIGVGDGVTHKINGSPFEVYSDGTIKIRGKNGSIIFDAVTGELDIIASSFKVASGAVATSSIYKSYQVGTSGTITPTGTWLEAIPEVPQGQYLWTKTITNYSDGTIKTDHDVIRQSTDGEDATTLRLSSSRGNVFKNSAVSTVLSVVVYKGSKLITDIDALKTEYGNGAYLQWMWQRMGENSFGTILSTDSRVGDGGFTFTLSPQDVDTKVTFMCQLITE